MNMDEIRLKSKTIYKQIYECINNTVPLTYVLIFSLHSTTYFFVYSVQQNYKEKIYKIFLTESDFFYKVEGGILYRFKILYFSHA